jgi:hypothetical protein
LPTRLTGLLHWNDAWQWGLLGLGMLLFGWFFVKTFSMKQRLFVGVTTLVVLWPLVPAFPTLAPRHLFLAVFCGSLLFGAVLQAVSRIEQRPKLVQAGVLMLGMGFMLAGLKAVQSYPLWTHQGGIDRYRAEGTFVLHAPEQRAVLLNPVGDGWFYASLQWLRINTLALDAGPSFCYDPCVCSLDDMETAYRYQRGRLESVPVPQAGAEPVCGDEAMDLTIEMRMTDQTLIWRFGPYSEDRYAFSGAWPGESMTGQFHVLPHEGRRAVVWQGPLRFVIRYKAPDGVTTYSPVLTLESEQTPVMWQRTH